LYRAVLGGGCRIQQLARIFQDWPRVRRSHTADRKDSRRYCAGKRWVRHPICCGCLTRSGWGWVNSSPCLRRPVPPALAHWPRLAGLRVFAQREVNHIQQVERAIWHGFRARVAHRTAQAQCGLGGSSASVSNGSEIPRQGLSRYRDKAGRRQSAAAQLLWDCLYALNKSCTGIPSVPKSCHPDLINFHRDTPWGIFGLNFNAN